MSVTVKRLLQLVLTCVLAVLVTAVSYVIYLQANYYRIDDALPTQIEDQVPDATLAPGASYTATSYNIGFGAYTADYSFFLDTGVMKDGTKTQGEHGTAVSEESVRTCTEGDIETIAALHPDFALFQEVDTDSDRSYHVNQKEALASAFAGWGSTFACNFHSAYLAYPFDDPHGASNSGLLTLANKTITSATRYSYPVSDDFVSKFFDLDRCFEVTRFAVDNGKELVLVNSHMSAYDEGGQIRKQQLEKLNAFMAGEVAAGNYVIVGGDFNHALCGSESLYPSEQQVPGWAVTLDDEDLASGMHVVRAENLTDVATCRSADMPYVKGVDYETTVDGFIVSENVTASARNIDVGYAFSDHNPVQLTFVLD